MALHELCRRGWRLPIWSRPRRMSKVLPPLSEFYNFKRNIILQGFPWISLLPRIHIAQTARLILRVVLRESAPVYLRLNSARWVGQRMVMRPGRF